MNQEWSRPLGKLVKKAMLKVLKPLAISFLLLVIHFVNRQYQSFVLRRLCTTVQIGQSFSSVKQIAKNKGYELRADDGGGSIIVRGWLFGFSSCDFSLDKGMVIHKRFDES